MATGPLLARERSWSATIGPLHPRRCMTACRPALPAPLTRPGNLILIGWGGLGPLLMYGQLPDEMVQDSPIVVDAVAENLAEGVTW